MTPNEQYQLDQQTLAEPNYWETAEGRRAHDTAVYRMSFTTTY